MEDDMIDYDGLLQAHLKRVFSEPDAGLRKAAVAEIYAPDAVFYEPGHVATGHDEITRTVDALVTSFPPGFVFAAEGPAVGHHGLARLRWRLGPADGPIAATGTDVVRIEQGRIKTIHVFLDPTPA